MRTLPLIAMLGLMAMATPVCAATLTELYDEAVAEAEQGASILAQADWQYRDGNVQEGCRIMERARLHYSKAYEDVSAMEAMVNDPAGGYSDEDRGKVNDWIVQQKTTMNTIGGQMAQTYQAKCQ